VTITTILKCWLSPGIRLSWECLGGAAWPSWALTRSNAASGVAAAIEHLLYGKALEAEWWTRLVARNGRIGDREQLVMIARKPSAMEGAARIAAKASVLFCAAAIVLLAHPATAAELATLRNGFSPIPHDHHLVMGVTTRLSLRSTIPALSTFQQKKLPASKRSCDSGSGDSARRRSFGIRVCENCCGDAWTCKDWTCKDRTGETCAASQ